MKYFLKEFTEPISYLLYCLILSAAYIKAHKKVYKLLAWYYGILSLLLFSSIVQNEMDVDNNWNYNLMFLLTIFAFSYYYRSLYHSLLKKRFVTVCFSACLLAFLYFNIVEGQFENYYNNYFYACVFLSIITYSFLYLHDLLSNVSEENILSKFDFWFVSANLFYFLGAFLVILFYAYAEKNMRGSVWIIQNVVLFVSSLIALRGYMAIAKKKS